MHSRGGLLVLALRLEGRTRRHVRAHPSAHAGGDIHGIRGEQDEPDGVLTEPELRRHLPVGGATDQLDARHGVDDHRAALADRSRSPRTASRPEAGVSPSFARHCSSTSSATAVGSVSSLCPTTAVNMMCPRHSQLLTRCRVLPIDYHRFRGQCCNSRARHNEASENACGSRLTRRLERWRVEGRRGNPAPTFRVPFDISGDRSLYALRRERRFSARNGGICAASAPCHVITRRGTQSALRPS